MDFSFNVSIYSKLQRYTDTISKARVRIFYKGANRNGTYITDEFAENLLKTIPYTPVKGIFDDTDYTDHGKKRSEGKIYGIVPENPNIAWENHLDDDGVERSYACADVLIFSALYGETDSIVDKGQSMELYTPSIQGSWKKINGQQYYVFTEASFLGLQVLGDDVEPCFEGAAFYSLKDVLTRMIDQLNIELETYQNLDRRKPNMNTITFELSNSQVERSLWELLNPRDGEDDYSFRYSILDVYSDYAICYNYEAKEYVKVYYSVSEDDKVTLGDREKVYIVAVNEEENNALKKLREGNDSYTQVSEKFTELTQENERLSGEIVERDNTISTLNQNNQDLTEQLSEANQNYSTAQGRITELEGTVSSLESYKLEQEKADKQKVLDKYSELLDEETIQNYTKRLAEYTCKDLDKELAYELVQADNDLFTKIKGYVPKDAPKSGIEELLDKYEK